MGIKLHVFRALFKKDFKNCFMNRNVSLMLALPILFVLLYKFILNGGADESFSAYYTLLMCSVLTLSVIPLNILAMLISEEKEKHTLRSLMMANVSGAEFISSKAAVCLILMMSEGIIIYLLCGLAMNLMALYLGVIFIVSLAIIIFGAVVGISAKDQMAAGTLGTPLMMLFLIPPVFSTMNNFFEKVSVLVPTTSLYTIYGAVYNDQPLMSKDNIIAFGVCLAWIIIGNAAFMRIYKKKGLDD